MKRGIFIMVVCLILVIASTVYASIDDFLAKLKEAYITGDIQEFKNQLFMLYTIYIGQGEKRLIEVEISDQSLLSRETLCGAAIPLGYGFYATNIKLTNKGEARLDCEVINKSHYPDVIIIVAVSFYNENSELLGVWSRDVFFDYNDNVQNISAVRPDIKAEDVHAVKMEITSILPG